MHIGLYEILGSFALLFVVTVSRSTELIGAELVLPIIKLAFNFRHKESVELAAPAIWLAVLIKFIAALLRKDEKYKDRKVIDFKFATVIMPLVLVGAFWGEVVHGTVAPIIESTIFALVVGYLLFKCFVELIKEYKEHKKEMMEIKHAPIDNEEIKKDLNGETSESVASDDGSPKMLAETDIVDEIQPSDDSVNNFAINKEKEEESTDHTDELNISFKEIIDDGKYDLVYKPRYIKRGVPILIMIVLLSKIDL
jgi:hypothetical protein